MYYLEYVVVVVVPMKQTKVSYVMRIVLTVSSASKYSKTQTKRMRLRPSTKYYVLLNAAKNHYYNAHSCDSTQKTPTYGPH